MRIASLILLLLLSTTLEAQVVINELMYAPRAPEPEWIEVYALEDVNIEGWTIHDEVKSVKVPSFFLRTGEFAILTKDSSVFTAYYPTLTGIIVSVPSLPSFNNDDDVVVLSDSSGRIIDSVHYFSTWHYKGDIDNRGYSLERRSYIGVTTDSNNWSTPLDTIKATPLDVNTLSNPKVTEPLLTATCTPNPFSPDGDGYNDELVVEITIPSPSEEMISAYLYDLEGTTVATVARDRRIVGRTNLTFDGRSDEGKILPVGLYSLIVSSPNHGLGKKKIGVVIAKRKQ